MRALTPLKKYRFRVFSAPMLKGVECLCELVIPFIVRAIIDQGLTQGGDHYQDYAFVFLLCGAVFGLSLLGFLATMVTQYVSSMTTTRFSFELKKNIFDHIGKLSQKQLEDYGTSKAMNLINSSSFSLQQGVQMFMRLLVRAPMLVVGSVIAAFVVSPYAGLAVAGLLFLCSLVIFIVAKVTPKRYKALTDELDSLNRMGDDAILGGRVVRAFNKEKESEELFAERSLAYQKQGIRVARINALVNPLTFGFINLAVVLVIYLGSYAKPTTGISVGSIVALVSFLTQSLNALIQFTRLLTSLSKAYEANTRINAFFLIEPDIIGGEKHLDALSDEVAIFELRGACVNFGGENDALHDIDFLLRKGERVGVIGGTGSGKSTLIALLLRFLDAKRGEVFFEGNPIAEFDLDSLRGECALVSQKPQLFQGTIRENLTLGRSYSEEEIEAALRDALAYDVVQSKEGGLDSRVDEGGANFSGGQKQRLLIARALLSNREVLILDDATSALDYKSDSAVRANIARRGNTLLLISQRATSVKGCDRIYVLDQGKVVGVGTHDELVSSCQVYREIYEAQVNQR